MENAIRTMESWLSDHSGQKAFDEWTEEKIEQGREQGLEQGIVQTAKNFLRIGVSPEDVMKATGLTRKEIDALK